MEKFLKKYWHVIFVILITVVVSWALFAPGYFPHHDDLQVIRINQMRKCILDFQIPCRWVPDMGYGYGYPIFNYYGVGVYYIGSILSFLVGYIKTIKLLFLFSNIVGALGIYLLAKELFGKFPSLLAVTLYVLSPYRAVDIFVRGALSEIFGLSLFPIILYLYLKVINNGDKKYFVFAVLVNFIFLITHNISNLLLIPVLIAYIVVFLVNNKFKGYFKVGATLIISLFLSAFYLLPSFFEKKYISTDYLKTMALDFRAHFVSLNQIFISRYWGYGSSGYGLNDGMSFQLGIIHWIIAFVGIILFFIVLLKKYKYSGKNKIIFDKYFSLNNTNILFIAFTIIIFGISIFMMHIRSAFIWENISVLEFVQFPWRFLMISIFCMSMLGAYAISFFKNKLRLLFFSLITILLLIFNLGYFKPKEFNSMNDSNKLNGIEWENQQKGAIGDYLPITAKIPDRKADSLPKVLSGDASFKIINKRTNSFEYEVKVINKSVIDLPVFDFPNWNIFINNSYFKHTYNPGNGLIQLTLKEGNHKLSGKLYNTPLRKISNSLSLIGLILFIMVIIKYERFKPLHK